MTCHVDKSDDIACDLRRKRIIEFHSDARKIWLASNFPLNHVFSVRKVKNKDASFFLNGTF